MVNLITSEDEANNQVFESADLNIDGLINVLDIVLTVSSVLGHGNLNGEQLLSADVNMDGKKVGDIIGSGLLGPVVG